MEEELGHMEGKKVLEELVGAIQNKLTERKIPSYSYHSGGRTWPHGAAGGSLEAT